MEVGTLNVRAGGPPFSMSRQMYGLLENGVDSVCVMPPCDEDDIIDLSLDYHFCEPAAFSCLGFDYIPQIDKSFSKIKDINLIHIQDVWTYFSHSAAQYARHSAIPYVIAPRGSLYKRAMGGRKWLKKQIAWYAYQKYDINHADCIQATCTDEMKELRALGCKVPIAIIPNSCDATLDACDTYNDDGFFRIGYLGRLSPRKHVEKVIYALAELKKKYDNVRLLIIGKDDEKYENFLKLECRRLKLGDLVEFAGFLKGNALDQAIRQCNIFVFPSDFENWGNVVSEVLVREIPVITTIGMPWEILKEKLCGWWIDPSQATINNTLFAAYNMEYDELRLMGKRGRTLVEERFSVGAVGEKLKNLYNWILTGGAMPDFVYL